MAPKKGAKKGAKRAAKTAGAPTKGVSHDQIVNQIASLTFWVKALKAKAGWSGFEPQDAINDVGEPNGAKDPPRFP